MLTADQNTRDDVEAIISAGFEMASKAPIRRRDQAFREASFQVPYELPRLNAAAPRFRIEDMGPMPPLKKTWKEIGEIGMHIPAPFDVEKEARVFLYFPNDAPRATAAFLAINADFRPVEYKNAQGQVSYRTHEDHLRLFMIATTIWICQTINWRRHRPHILDRVEPGQLPVIMSFREWACGSLWDTRAEMFIHSETDRELMSLTRITR